MRAYRLAQLVEAAQRASEVANHLKRHSATDSRRARALNDSRGPLWRDWAHNALVRQLQDVLVALPDTAVEGAQHRRRCQHHVSAPVNQRRRAVRARARECGGVGSSVLGMNAAVSLQLLLLPGFHLLKVTRQCLALWAL